MSRKLDFKYRNFFLKTQPDFPQDSASLSFSNAVPDPIPACQPVRRGLPVPARGGLVTGGSQVADEGRNTALARRAGFADAQGYIFLPLEGESMRGSGYDDLTST